MSRRRESRRKVVELDIREERSMQKYEKLGFARRAKGVDHRAACAVCDHIGRADSQAVSNGQMATITLLL